MHPVLAALLPVLAAAPQQAREPVPLAASASPVGPALASDGELSAALWTDELANDLFLSVSDGRGLAWSPPAPVDQAPPGVFIGSPMVEIEEQRAFAAWFDDRYHDPLAPVIAETPFLRVYDAVTGALGPELQVPTGSDPVRTWIGGLGLDAERVGAELRAHVGLLVHVTPLGHPPYSELRLVTSTDGGASFLPALTAPLSLSSFPHSLALQAEGDVVHLAWIDERDGTPQVYYQRSSDGGQTFDFAPEKQLTSGTHKLDLVLDVQGSTLAFAVAETIPDFTFADVRAAVSTDAGTSFGPLQSMVDVSPVLALATAPALAVASGGAAVVLAWQDMRLGSQHVFASRTVDGGVTWSPDAQLSSTPGNLPSLSASGVRERVVAAWRENGVRPTASVSLDGGGSFEPLVELWSGTMYAYAYPRLAYNDLYQNLIAGWSENASPHALAVGGFRPQTLAPSGFTAGPTQVGAAFERFDDGRPLAFLLASTQAGDLQLPFGDLRNSGLALTPLLLASANLAASGTFAALLDPEGDGALAPIATSLPAGVTLYALGLSFDLATLSIGDVSDVVRIEL